MRPLAAQMAPGIDALGRPRGWTWDGPGVFYTDLSSFRTRSERGFDEQDDYGVAVGWHPQAWFRQREEGPDRPGIWSESTSLVMQRIEERMRDGNRYLTRAEERQLAEELLRRPGEIPIIGIHDVDSDRESDTLSHSEPTDQRDIIWFRCGSAEPECLRATGGLVGTTRKQYSGMLQKKVSLCCSTCQWELHERAPEVKVVYNGGEFSRQANDTNHLRMMLEVRRVEGPGNGRSGGEERWTEIETCPDLTNSSNSEGSSSEGWIELNSASEESATLLDPSDWLVEVDSDESCL